MESYDHEFNNEIKQEDEEENEFNEFTEEHQEIKEIELPSPEKLETHENEENRIDNINDFDTEFDLEKIISKNIREHIHALESKPIIPEKLLNDKEELNLKSKITELQMIKEELEKIEKIQRIKLDNLKIEIESKNSELEMKDCQINELDNKGKDIKEDSRKYLNQINFLNKRFETLNTSIASISHNIKDIEKEGMNSKNNSDSLKKEQKKLESLLNKKDIKINKLQEELNNIKIQIRQDKFKTGMKNNECKKINGNLLEINKDLEKQKIELLQAFKRQLKLIDVLRRQRFHLEAGQIFQYTQQDFMRALELGDKL